MVYRVYGRRCDRAAQCLFHSFTRCMELWDSVIRMVSSLGVVLGLLFLGTVVIRRFFPGQVSADGASPVVRIIGSGYVGPRKRILVVAVAGEVLILGTTANELISLGRVTNQEQLTRLVPEHTGKPQTEPLQQSLVALSRPQWMNRFFGQDHTMDVNH